jgi:NAD(P)-dependent dehydrogenase (short-subunit alcohol dehydrogenase family)
MKLADKIVVVTGAASGIGQALCRRFAEEQVAGIVAADLDADGARATAAEVGGLGVGVDVSVEAQVQGLCEQALARYGRIDVFCSNAGVISRRSERAPDADWMRAWGVNVMGHVYAARAVLPHMLARGEGYLLQTVSAAGLITQVDAAPYAVTKHASLAFAEWLSIAYGGQGIRVSALCPQGVRTPMLKFERDERGSWLDQGSVSAEEVAEVVVRGMEAERFLILPHPEVIEYFRRKSSDYDRWIRGMRRYRADIMKNYGREDA